MKYLLIICCVTEEEIFLYIYPINIQLKRTRRYFARGRASYSIFFPSFSTSFPLFFSFFYFALRRAAERDTRLQRHNSAPAVVAEFRLEELASRARKRYGAPESDREKKLRTRRAIIYRG